MFNTKITDIEEIQLLDYGIAWGNAIRTGQTVVISGCQNSQSGIRPGEALSSIPLPKSFRPAENKEGFVIQLSPQNLTSGPITVTPDGLIYHSSSIARNYIVFAIAYLVDN